MSRSGIVPGRVVRKPIKSATLLRCSLVRARRTTKGVLRSLGATVERGEPTDLERLFSDLNPNMLRRLLARANYSTRHEQEAELLASLIRTTADASAERVPEQPVGVLDKLEAALGFGAQRVR